MIEERKTFNSKARAGSGEHRSKNKGLQTDRDASAIDGGWMRVNNSNSKA